MKEQTRINPNDLALAGLLLNQFDKAQDMNQLIRKTQRWLSLASMKRQLTRQEDHRDVVNVLIDGQELTLHLDMAHLKNSVQHEENVKQEMTYTTSFWWPSHCKKSPSTLALSRYQYLLDEVDRALPTQNIKLVYANVQIQHSGESLQHSCGQFRLIWLDQLAEEIWENEGGHLLEIKQLCLWITLYAGRLTEPLKQPNLITCTTKRPITFSMQMFH